MVSLLALVLFILWSFSYLGKLVDSLRSQKFLGNFSSSLLMFNIQEIFKTLRTSVLSCCSTGKNAHLVAFQLPYSIFKTFMSICSVTCKTVGIDLVNAYEFFFLVGSLFCFP